MHMNSPHILMLYRGMELGGIETLIVRLANFLSSEGVCVTVATRRGPLVELLSKSVKYVELPADLHYLSVNKIVARSASKITNLMVLSFDPSSRFLAEYTLQNIVKKNPTCRIVHLSGCFHPRAYFPDGARRLHRRLNKSLAKFLGHSGLFFMNKPCRDNHAAALNLRPAEGSIIEVPTRISNASWTPSLNNEIIKIVAVGRIVGFKAYNFGLLDAAESLAKMKIDTKVSIFGHGEQEELLISEIDRRGLSGIVNFKGPLDYSEFELELKKHDLFVGMGTAALEAAGSGMPTIFAVDSERTKCLGFTHELPSGAVGERIPGHSERELIECILHYYKLDTLERERLGLLGRSVVSSHTEDRFCSELYRLAQFSEPCRYSIIKLFALSSYFKIVKSFPKAIRIMQKKLATS